MMLSSYSKQDSECSETSWMLNGPTNIVGDIKVKNRESDELSDIVLVDNSDNSVKRNEDSILEKEIILSKNVFSPHNSTDGYGASKEEDAENDSGVIVGQISSEMMQQLGKSLFDRDSVREDDKERIDESIVLIQNKIGNESNMNISSMEKKKSNIFISYPNNYNTLDDKGDEMNINNIVKIDIRESLGNSSIMTDDVSSPFTKKNDSIIKNDTSSFYYNHHKYYNTRKQESDDYFNENHFALSSKKRSIPTKHQYLHSSNNTVYKKKKYHTKSSKNKNTYLLYILIPSCLFLLLSGIILILYRKITELQKEISSLQNENKRILYECSHNHANDVLDNNVPYFINHNTTTGYFFVLVWRHMVPIFWFILFLCLGYCKKCISVRIVQSSNNVPVNTSVATSTNNLSINNK